MDSSKSVHFEPGFHMIVTIVAIVTIVQKLDCTIATTHGFHMIVAIVVVAAVFMVESIKPDDRYSGFTSVVTYSISLPILSQSDRLLKLLVVFLCFMKTESHSNLRILFVQSSKEQTFPF